MFYISTPYGFYSSEITGCLFNPDIRRARPFPTFNEADLVAKVLLKTSTKQYYCIVRPA